MAQQKQEGGRGAGEDHAGRQDQGVHRRRDRELHPTQRPDRGDAPHGRRTRQDREPAQGQQPRTRGREDRQRGTDGAQRPRQERPGLRRARRAGEREVQKEARGPQDQPGSRRHLGAPGQALRGRRHEDAAGERVRQGSQKNGRARHRAEASDPCGTRPRAREDARPGARQAHRRAAEENRGREEAPPGRVLHDVRGPLARGGEERRDPQRAHRGSQKRRGRLGRQSENRAGAAAARGGRGPEEGRGRRPQGRGTGSRAEARVRTRIADLPARPARRADVRGPEVPRARRRTARRRVDLLRGRLRLDPRRDAAALPGRPARRARRRRRSARRIRRSRRRRARWSWSPRSCPGSTRRSGASQHTTTRADG